MSRASHRYRAHGITIDSEIELPELVPFDGEPGIVIRYGEVPAALERTTARGRRYAAAPGEFLLQLPRVARYWVRNGCEVMVAAVPGASADEVRLYLLSSVMAALVHQRGALAMHASAVNVDGACVLFAGRPGAGKSTLAAAFHQRACHVVAEDLSVISIGEAGHPQVHAGSRHFRLSPDTLAFINPMLSKGPSVRGKYHVAFAGDVIMAPMRVDRVFLLDGTPGETAAIRPVAGGARVAAIAAGTYRRPMSRVLGQSKIHFALCVAVGRQVPVVRLSRTASLTDLPALVDLIHADIKAARGRAGV